MRVFAETPDYDIVSVSDFYENHDAIYFTFEGRYYRHLKKDSYRTLAPFQQLVDDEWLYTMRISYLHIFDEEENEELNYFESTDFNAGVIYCRIEKSVVKHLIKEDANEISISVDLPKIQMLVDGVFDNENKVMDNTLSVVKHHFEAVYGKSFTIDEMNWYRNKQYITINYKIVRKVQPKEMTIEQIEEALGYKIKVVGKQ